MLGSYDSICQASTCQASSVCSFECNIPWQTEWYHLHCHLKNIHQILGDVFNRYIGDMHHDSAQKLISGQNLHWNLHECFSRMSLTHKVSLFISCKLIMQMFSQNRKAYNSELKQNFFVYLASYVFGLTLWLLGHWVEQGRSLANTLNHTLYSSLSSWSTLKALRSRV